MERTEATIRTYLAHLSASLRWAVDIGLLPKTPKIQRPKRARRTVMMKGRPLTAEEFERILDKTEAVVDPIVAASWRRYLTGLWLSGLRLDESLDLWWDRDDRLCVDLVGKRPMLRIPGELEKGNRDRLLPMAPEFAEFLAATPEHKQTGRVFEPGRQRAGNGNLVSGYVGVVISKIGRAAGVKVYTNPTSGKLKYASAHDFRRSFGARWAPRVMPHVLKELMRHESIETTLRYYVGRNAEATADVLWEAHEKAGLGNTSGNSAAIDVQKESPEDASTYF